MNHNPQSAADPRDDLVEYLAALIVEDAAREFAPVRARAVAQSAETVESEHGES